MTTRNVIPGTMSHARSWESPSDLTASPYLAAVVRQQGAGDAADAEAAHAREMARSAGRAAAAKDTPRGSLRLGRPASRQIWPRPVREKIFGDARETRVDRDMERRIMERAHKLKRRSVKGQHYGLLTGKFIDVLEALLRVLRTVGRTARRCFPSMLTLARMADCNKDTVNEAIKALEKAGLLSWCNRIERRVIDGITKVVRTSNSYWFHDPGSKSEFTKRPLTAVIQERTQEIMTALVAPDLLQVEESSFASKKGDTS